MIEIKGKILLITGGSVGIGACVVKHFLKEGIKHVTILDINEKNGLDIEKELNTQYGNNKVKFIKCDVTQEQEVVNAFNVVKSEQGYIDIVINNAGIVTDKDFVKVIDVNLTALMRCSLQAWELMRQDRGGKGGTVINIASIAGIGHYPFLTLYSGTKAAVVKFSTTLGAELHYSTSGVRVLTICFGVTETQMINEKIPSFNEDIEDLILSSLRSFNVQTAEQAAWGLIEVYKQGQSGSVWIVANGKPAEDVTNRYMDGCKAYNDIIFN